MYFLLNDFKIRVFVVMRSTLSTFVNQFEKEKERDLMSVSLLFLFFLYTMFGWRNSFVRGENKSIRMAHSPTPLGDTNYWI